MIVVDSSALMAVVKKEAAAPACRERLFSEGVIFISAATLAEVLIVAQRRGVRLEMTELIDAIGPEVEPVDERTARSAAEAYAQFGKGIHSAKLNYGDCFAYALAKAKGAPLLYVGDDFSRTDIDSALVG